METINKPTGEKNQYRIQYHISAWKNFPQQKAGTKPGTKRICQRKQPQRILHRSYFAEHRFPLSSWNDTRVTTRVSNQADP